MQNKSNLISAGTYFRFLIILDFPIDFIRPMKYIRFTDVWAVSRT